MATIGITTLILEDDEANRRLGERRADDLTPIREQRTGDRRQPRWLTWTRQNESRGKSLDGRAA